MFTIIYQNYTSEEINKHWIGQKVPEILQDLSVRAFSLCELKRSLKSLENLPNIEREGPIQEIRQVKHALKDVQKNISYSLFLLDKLSVMIV